MPSVPMRRILGSIVGPMRREYIQSPSWANRQVGHGGLVTDARNGRDFLDGFGLQMR